MKTSELTGDALNWAVAKALGFTPRIEWRPLSTPKVLGICVVVNNRTIAFDPATDPSQSHPIIEREGISLEAPCHSDNGMGAVQHITYWVATGKTLTRIIGPTLLIAAMRCYVASKLGDDVDVPEELK